ncbi:MAG TPA: DOMON-like domain-containing protein [Rhodocyclaceae bacterium]|nr:DOMON-like domain-containing protein [Rhodocyclaceae bacterium]
MTLSASLHCHPASPCPAVSTLQATCTQVEDGLQLRFVLRGDVQALRVPAGAQGGFADELWRHTCLEAFVGTTGATAYREFNFSPSGQWAAYAFTDYRQRDLGWQPVQAPQILTRTTPDSLILEARIPATLLPAGAGLLHIGLTAVIETSDGAISYWALMHPGERPDFHLSAAFTLQCVLNTAQP